MPNNYGFRMKVTFCPATGWCEASLVCEIDIYRLCDDLSIYDTRRVATLTLRAFQRKSTEEIETCESAKYMPLKAYDAGYENRDFAPFGQPTVSIDQHLDLFDFADVSKEVSILISKITKHIDKFNLAFVSSDQAFVCSSALLGIGIVQIERLHTDTKWSIVARKSLETGYIYA